MTLVIQDRVLESSITTGVGAFALSGAVLGYRTFASVCAVADTLWYYIEGVDSFGKPSGEYEYGLGTYSAANTLTRTTVRGSSNGGAAVNFTTGAKLVGIGVLAPSSLSVKMEWLAALGADAPFGQCRLIKSGANLLLNPHDGNKLTINGATYAVPSAGVSLAATALTPGTTYNIYAYMNAGTMTLEASATAYAIGTADPYVGVAVKNGDSSRTLVGMARVITGPAWADTEAQRFVISWFNRRPIVAMMQLGSTATTTSATYVEMNAAYRAEFLSWADTQAIVSGHAATASSIGAGGSQNFAVAIDLSVPTNGQSQIAAAGQLAQAVGPCGVTVTDGYHYASMLGAVSGGATLSVYSGMSGVSVQVAG